MCPLCFHKVRQQSGKTNKKEGNKERRKYQIKNVSEKTSVKKTDVESVDSIMVGWFGSYEKLRHYHHTHTHTYMDIHTEIWR